MRETFRIHERFYAIAMCGASRGTMEKAMSENSRQETGRTLDSIKFIRSQLSMGATELAVLVGVQRDEFQAWMRGDQTPEIRTAERLTQLYEIAQVWELKSCGPLCRRLRCVFEEGEPTLFGLLKSDALDIYAIQKQLDRLCRLPANRPLSVRELAAKQGLSTAPKPNSEAAWLSECGRPFASDFEESWQRTEAKRANE